MQTHFTGPRRFIALLALLLGACTSTFDPANYLTGVRVIAVKAEPPDVAPGERSSLTALAVDTSGAALTIDWAACHEANPPGAGGAVNPDCLTHDTASFLEPLPSGPTTVVTMPRVFPTELGAPDDTGGFYLPVRVRPHAADGSDTGVYLLRYFYGFPSACLRMPLAPNHNPVLSGVLVDPGAGADPVPLDGEAPHPLRAGEHIDLRARFADGSAETYQVLQGDPCKTPPRYATEPLEVEWLSDGGSFSERTTGPDKDTRLTLDKHVPGAGTIIHVYAVGRDDRGGTDWQIRTFVVE